MLFLIFKFTHQIINGSLKVEADCLLKRWNKGIAFYTLGADTDVGQDVIRFRNTNNNTYLFALGEEVNSIRQNFADVFVEEGVAFEVNL